MSQVFRIARDEWRYWRRSRLATAASALFLFLALVTGVLTSLRQEAEAELRNHHQAEAEEAFLSQPDRHPHRMIHYGHYVFRSPPPLAAFDPGIDSVTGTAVFLEGHRQNSASFAAAGASAQFGGLAWLTPAFIYQLLGPLLLIILGHGALAREREGRTLQALSALGVSGGRLVLGKAVALGGGASHRLVTLGVYGRLRPLGGGKRPACLGFARGLRPIPRALGGACPAVLHRPIPAQHGAQPRLRPFG